jgi:hypothetical protein
MTDLSGAEEMSSDEYRRLIGALDLTIASAAPVLGITVRSSFRYASAASRCRLRNCCGRLSKSVRRGDLKCPTLKI